MKLFNHRKPRSAIREYDLTGSAFDKRIKRINATGSIHGKDNRTPTEQELPAAERELAAADGKRYIEASGWFNNLRLHNTLGYLSR